MNSLPAAIRRLADQLRRRPLLALAALFLLALLAGVLLGRQSAFRELGLNPETLGEMQLEVPALREALRETLGELEIQRTRNEVDRRALELLRGEIAAEKERSAELEEGLSFYRSTLASEDAGSGLSLRTPELVPGASPGLVKYRFFVQRRDRDYENVEGTLSVEIIGNNGMDAVSYALGDLSQDFDDSVATLQFRYFQAIEGELALPEGFEPTGITMSFSASKPRVAEAREQFSWELQERFINVGK